MNIVSLEEWRKARQPQGVRQTALLQLSSAMGF
jgi:hypothetical protein